MIDFHSHILPGMDDGSADAEAALIRATVEAAGAKLLRLSENKGKSLLLLPLSNS